MTAICFYSTEHELQYYARWGSRPQRAEVVLFLGACSTPPSLTHGPALPTSEKLTTDSDLRTCVRPKMLLLLCDCAVFGAWWGRRISPNPSPKRRYEDSGHDRALS